MRYYELLEATPWLRITPTMLSQAKGNKSQLIVTMPADVFLSMTTSNSSEANNIKQTAKPLSAYNRWAKIGDNEKYDAWVQAHRKTKWEQDTDPDKKEFEKEYGSILMPFLIIRLNDAGTSGKVVSHEGRHRAAALLNVSNPTIPVALKLIPGKDMFPDIKFGAEYHITSEHLPTYITSQYNDNQVPTNNWNVVDNLQKV